MDLLAAVFATRETIEENGRCFEIDREIGYIAEVSCSRDVGQIFLIGFVVLLGGIWWFGYGPGARQRNQEKRERDDRIRRSALEQAGVLVSRDDQRRPVTPVPSMTPGQLVLHVLHSNRHLFESNPGEAGRRLMSMPRAFDEVELAEASAMLERFPISDAPFLANYWTEEEATAAKAIIDQVRLELPDRPE